MANSRAAIEYDPEPSEPRHGIVVRPLLISAAVLMVGIGGWVLRGWIDSPGMDPAVVGQSSEFPAGSVTEVVLDAGHFDPFGLESPSAEPPVQRKVSETRLFVVSESRGELLALSQRSPWLGCRVGLVTRAQAIEFGHEPPADFERGFLDPCHGGLFSLKGQHLAGPGDRGLNRFPVGYLSDGQAVVDLTGVQATTPSA